MNALLTPLSLTPEGLVSPGETLWFWIVAPLVVVAALGLVFAKKAVHSAVALVFVMIGLATFYIAQAAIFLGIVQIVVYTGAIMMLFLFVLMLIGVDASESVIETIKGQRVVAGLFGLGVVVGLAGIILGSTMPAPVGTTIAEGAATNPESVAHVIFGEYPFAMELTGALLIVAALAAMTLTHMDRIGEKVTQKEIADEKLRAWQDHGARISQLTAPGVYARSNSTAVAAQGPDAQPIAASVPHVLRIRGQEIPIAEVAPEANAAVLAPEPVGLSTMPGMPGQAAPSWDAPAGPAPELEAGPEGAPSYDVPAGEPTTDQKEDER